MYKSLHGNINDRVEEVQILEIEFLIKMIYLGVTAYCLLSACFLF